MNIGNSYRKLVAVSIRSSTAKCPRKLQNGAIDLLDLIKCRRGCTISSLRESASGQKSRVIESDHARIGLGLPANTVKKCKINIQCVSPSANDPEGSDSLEIDTLEAERLKSIGINNTCTESSHVITKGADSQNRAERLRPGSLSNTSSESSHKIVENTNSQSCAERLKSININKNYSESSHEIVKSTDKLSWTELILSHSSGTSNLRNKGSPLTMEEIIECIKQNRGRNIVVIDVRRKIPGTEYLIVLEGSDESHLSDIAYSVKRLIKGRIPSDYPFLSTEEYISGCGQDWVSLRMYRLFIHCLMPEVRKRLALERLWTLIKPMFPIATLKQR